MVVKYHFRLYLFSLLILGAFVTLVHRLYYLQIVREEEFTKRIPGAKKLRSRVPPVRGEIKDCNGIVLASNRPTFEVRINLKEVVDAKIAELKIASGGKPVVLPKVPFRYREGGFPREKKETDIVAIMEEKVFKPLLEMRLAKVGKTGKLEYDADQLRRHFRTFGGTVPWVYRNDLTFEEFSAFAEINLQIAGVVPAVRPVRQYLYDAFACHIMGYVRLPDETLVPESERREWDFYVGDDFGFSGVEKTMDRWLKGEAGAQVWEVNEKGRMVGELKDEYRASKRGNDVWLTIDARIQAIAEKALRDPGLGRAAVVVLDVHTGAVKAMAAVPCYNPNKFIPTIDYDEFQAYLKNPVNPLFNRAIQPYAPGSTFKIVTAFAGVLAGKERSVLSCGGSVTYGKPMKCWNSSGHGGLDLSDAIMRSCNCYFYLLGNLAGIESIGKAGRMMGVGERTGIELEDENGGKLPSKEWLQLHMPNENWRSPGLTANTSIGQGFVEATPLQICSVAATVANGGKSFRPHLLNSIRQGETMVFDQKPDLRADLAAEGIDPRKIEVIRRGMWKVVNGESGTGKGAQLPELPGVEVAGKTGTAQFWRTVNGVKTKDNHTWFMSFAPYDKPRYAVCAMVQGGYSGGSSACPVVKRVLSQALALDQGFEVTIAATTEVKGNFNPVEKTTYPDDPLGAAIAAAAADGDTGEQAGERESTDTKIQEKKVADEAMIKRKRRQSEEPSTRSPQPRQSQPEPEPQTPAAPAVERPGLIQRILR
jgi:penicillin-binding protein 2